MSNYVLDETGKLVINSQCAFIPDRAFMNNQRITSVEIEYGVKGIGTEAFRGCSNLRSLVMPDSILSTGRAVFRACTSLINVRLSSGLNILNDSLFRSCSSLTSIVIPEGITLTRKRIFNQCSSLVNVELPHSLKEVGEEMFRGCQSLKKIEFVDGLEKLFESAFARANNLEQISLPSSVISIIPAETGPLLTCTIAAFKGTYAYNWMLERGYNIRTPDGKGATQSGLVRKELPISSAYLQEYCEPINDQAEIAKKLELIQEKLKQDSHSGADKMLPLLEQLVYHQAGSSQIIRLYEIYRLKGNDDKIEKLFNTYKNAEELCKLSKKNVKALLYIGEFDEAQKALDDVLRIKRIDYNSYQEIKLRILVYQGDFESAYKLSKDIIETADNFKFTVYEVYKKTCVNTGRIQEAIAFFRKEYQHSNKFPFLCALAELYCSANDYSNAMDIYRKMALYVLPKLQTNSRKRKDGKYFLEQLMRVEEMLNIPSNQRWSQGINPTSNGDSTLHSTADATKDRTQSFNFNESSNKDTEPRDTLNQVTYTQDADNTSSTDLIVPMHPPQNTTCTVPTTVDSEQERPQKSIISKRMLLQRVSKINKPVRKFFHVYLGDEETIEYSKSVLGSALLLIKNKFRSFWGKEKFIISKSDNFLEVFPVYKMLYFTNEEIVEITELLTKLEKMLLQFNPNIGHTNYKVGKSLAFLLNQKCSFLINGKEISYVSVDPITHELTVFGVVVFLSTFMDKDEKKAYLYFLSDGNTGYMKVLTKELFSLIPSAERPTWSTENYHHIRSFDYFFYCLILSNFVMTIECYIDVNSDVLSPGAPNKGSKPFAEKISSYFGNSTQLALPLTQIFEVYKRAIMIGEDILEIGKAFSVHWLVERIKVCLDHCSDFDKNFFRQRLQYICNLLFTYKYFPILEAISTRPGLDVQHNYNKMLFKLLTIEECLFTNDDESTILGYGIVPEIVSCQPLVSEKQLQNVLHGGLNIRQQTTVTFFSVDTTEENPVYISVDGKLSNKNIVMVLHEEQTEVKVVSSTKNFLGWEPILTINNTIINLRWYRARLEK